ncbi:MAG: hypothetical protein LBU32_22445 [Clostridiales bacterium]|jgi:glycosyl-4,4'-diaponeurosporenoate acyltransferase|nr:hypothetical protein [Clostridiales bacterium]
MDSLISNLILFLFFSISNTIASLALPLKWLNPRNRIFRSRAWEKGGAIYQKLFRVKKWKNSLPELGDFFKSIFYKKKIQRFDNEYLEIYVIESCRAELTHESIIAASFLFAIWAEASVFLTVIYISLLLNIPFIMIQRYNRPRILRMIKQTKPVYGELAEDITIG